MNQAENEKVDVDAHNYSLQEKLAGKDLYGLSERIPKEQSHQVDCDHEDMDDIPGTHLLKCPDCGYTRRY